MNIEYNHEQSYIKRLMSGIDVNSVILDVGCGTGRNLELLYKLGYKNIIGVDLNDSMVKLVNDKGFEAYNNLEFESEKKDLKIDVILMSHIIEHFYHAELSDFMSHYFSKLRIGGKIIISTPLFTNNFYNDFDHVKPYLPIGINMYFSNKSDQQIQSQSPYILSIRNIYFYKLPFRLQWYRTFYVNSGLSLPVWINRILKVVFYLTRGCIGVKSGWIAAYNFQGLRKVE